MATYFQPKPGRFGIAPAILGGFLNTGTLAAGTVNHNLGAYATRSYVNRATVCAATFPTAATGCTVQLVKMTGTTAVNLSAAISINAGTADTPIAIPITSTLTEAQRCITSADSLRVAVVTTGAVSVQPVDVRVNVELFVQE